MTESYQQRIWRLAVEDLQEAQREAEVERRAACVHPITYACGHTGQMPTPLDGFGWLCPDCAMAG